MTSIIYNNFGNYLNNGGVSFPQFSTDTNRSQFPPIKTIAVTSTTKCYAFIIE